MVSLLAILLWLPAIPAVAEQFFVSTPEEIEDAMRTAAPGDTLTMRNGQWTDVKIRFDGDGEPGKPILLRAETPGQVVLTGRSSIRIGGSYLTVDGLYFTNGYPRSSSHVVEFRTSDSRKAKHCRLTNSAIINYNPPSINTRYFWVSLYGEHNRVDHCYFSGQNHSGVTVVAWLDSDPAYHRIDHNYFGDRPPGPENGWETIRIGTSSKSGTNARVTVESNYFYRCDGEIEIISSKSNENVFRYNTFVECNGQLTLRHGKRCRVEGNFFFGNQVEGSSGVRLIDRDHVVINNYFEGLRGDEFRAAVVLMNGVPNSPLNRYFQVVNALVAFNTFVDCSNPLDIGVGKDEERTLPPVDCLIANNIVSTTTAATLIDYIDDPVNLAYAGNLMFGAPLGIEQPEGIALLDAGLRLGEDGLWRIDGDSPAVDAAVGAFPDVTVDLDGQARPDTLKDIGADELSVDSIRVRPLTREAVTPAWVKDVLTTVRGRDPVASPANFALRQNYPNPFNPETRIEFQLAEPGRVRLEIFTLRGEHVTVLLNETRPAGGHSVVWQAGNLPAGVYFYRFSVNGKVRAVRKALLVK